MKILFTTENIDWGGSELLWSETAIRLSEFNKVFICINNKIILPKKIESNKAIIIKRIKVRKFSFLEKIYNKIVPYKLALKQKENRVSSIKEISPDLVIINQGYNFNGVDLMDFCSKSGIRYITISQAVNEFYWPDLNMRIKMQTGYENAECNYFVSQDNINVTESQIGKKLTNAQLVRNPFNVPYNVDLLYPSDKEYYSLAFVGRYFFSAKGQDILLRVLSLHKWKARNLIINFYGSGRDKQNLIDLITLYDLKNVYIKDFKPTLDIWKENHGLILTSRYEGLPISLVEAMICSRMAIITDVSGSAEVITNLISGFIAKAPRVKELDKTLELAWKNRSNWQNMGINAKFEVQKKVEEDPVFSFSNNLIKLLK